MPQTKNEIAKTLYKQGVRASANSVAKVAESLGYESKLDYSDEEVAAIVAEFTKPAQEEPQAPQSVERQAPEALAQFNLMQQQMGSQMGASLNGMADELAVIADRRNSRKGDVVKALTYLYDPQVFRAECILEAAQILGVVVPEGQEQAFDSKEASFSNLVDPFAETPEALKQARYTFRTFAPASIAGCLPM